jgi:hypothetical protein
MKSKVSIVDRFRLWAVGALTDAQCDEFKAALAGCVVDMTDMSSNVGVAQRVLYGRPRTWGIELQARYN